MEKPKIPNGFLQKLKAINPSFRLSFEDHHWVVYGRWGQDTEEMDFLHVNGALNTYRPLDDRTLRSLKEIIRWMQHPRQNHNVMKELRRVKSERNLNVMEAEAVHLCKQYQRVIRRMSRLMGHSQGKLNIPY